MILYIDETEHEDYFIVAGLVADTERAVDLAYKRFKKSVANYPLGNDAKQKVFLEFKSTLIDKRFQKIKIKMLDEISSIDGAIIYSCYIKKHKNMKQILKESVYVTLLSNIINSIDNPIDVIFDEFKKNDFEQIIVDTFSDFDNVTSIKPFDSQQLPGLQFVDNICSVIRMHLTGQDDSDYYSIIDFMIKEV